MMPEPRQPERWTYDRLVTAVLARYADVERQVRRTLRDWVLEDDRSRAALGRVLGRVDGLLTAVTDVQGRAAADAVLAAAREADERARGWLPPEAGTVALSPYSPVQRDAAQLAADALRQRLTGVGEGAAGQARQIARQVAQRQTLELLLGASGSTRETVRRTAAEIAGRGVTGLVDAAGRSWSLTRYADMAVRTATREAVTEAAVTRYAAVGVRYVRVSEHAKACDVCQTYQGRTMRLDGGRDEYTDVGLALPPYHPSCRHVVYPVVPDGTSLLDTVMVAA